MHHIARVYSSVSINAVFGAMGDWTAVYLFTHQLFMKLHNV